MNTSETPIAWYITFGDDYGYNSVLFFETEEAARDAIHQMQEINEEEGLIYHTYRGNQPLPLFKSAIKAKFDL